MRQINFTIYLRYINIRDQIFKSVAIATEMRLKEYGAVSARGRGDSPRLMKWETSLS